LDRLQAHHGADPVAPAEYAGGETALRDHPEDDHEGSAGSLPGCRRVDAGAGGSAVHHATPPHHLTGRHGGTSHLSAADLSGGPAGWPAERTSGSADHPQVEHTDPGPAERETPTGSAAIHRPDTEPGLSRGMDRPGAAPGRRGAGFLLL